MSRGSTSRTLSHILDRLESGARPRGGVSGYDVGVVSIGGEHLNEDGGFRFINPRFVPSEFASQMRVGHIERGDILIVKDGATTGKAAFVGEDFPYSHAVINEHVFLLRPKRDIIIPRFLFYFLHSPIGQRQILASFRGATVGGIPRSFADVITVPVPTISDQGRTVAAIRRVEEARHLRKEADRRTAALIPALFLDMFGDPATNPKGWPVKRLGSCGILDRGRSRHRPRNDPLLLGGPYPLIQTGDVANAIGIVRTYSQTYSAAGLAQSKMWPAGTLCITIAANIAKTGILGFDACFPDSVVGFVPGDGIAVEYVREWFGFVQAEIEASAPQAAQKNINLKILNNLQIPVPPLPLQCRFASHVADVSTLGQRQSESRQRLDDLFDSLLQRAFDGGLQIGRVGGDA